MKVLPAGDNPSPLVLIELIQKLKVRDVMSRNLITAGRKTSLADIRFLMRDNKISGVPIREGRRLVGIISVEDIMNALADGYIQEPAEKHMSRNVTILEEEMPLSFAVEAFEKYSFNRFPVLNEAKELTGILSSRDITMRLLTEMNREISRLEETLQKDPVKEMDRMVRRYPVIQHDFTHAGKASTAIKQLLRESGMDSRTIRRISVAAYELEMNQAVHSLGGELIFITSRDRVELIARDRGPGIPDIEAAMREGYSTATEWIRSLGFGAGMGLPNIRRVSDEFSLTSSPAGTEVHALIHVNKEETPHENQ